MKNALTSFCMGNLQYSGNAAVVDINLQSGKWESFSNLSFNCDLGVLILLDGGITFNLD